MTPVKGSFDPKEVETHRLRTAGLALLLHNPNPYRDAYGEGVHLCGTLCLNGAHIAPLDHCSAQSY